MTEQRCQRHDSQDRERKEEGVRFGSELMGGAHDGHKHQQPEQGVVADIFEQRMHGKAPCVVRSVRVLSSGVGGCVVCCEDVASYVVMSWGDWPAAGAVLRCA